RVWTFIKIVSDDGLVGWSECTDSHGSPRAIEGVIKDLQHLLIGKDPRQVEKIFWDLYSATRQSTGSVIQKAIAGIENALLDIKAKALNIPVYELLGGPLRDTIRVYWSHCGTSRIRAADFVHQEPIQSLEGITAMAQEVKRRGFNAIKTNIALFGDKPHIYMPAFGKSEGGPELNADSRLMSNIETYIATWRQTLGDDVDLILDLNFNFKTEGFIKIGRMLEKYNLLWLEMDTYDARALRHIKDSIRIPICSGENLYGAREFRPYIENHAMDVVSVDVSWNGVLQSKKIADLAELYEMNIAPHNHHSHLGTFMTAHFAAAIPNLRIFEVDIDDVAWKDEIVTVLPHIENGILSLPQGPGWGIEVNEEVVKAHPWPK
ncbi:MAG: mandelate racemase/muconate lactonizing enzyme family protein, partial [Patescibacteria group bacterium]